MVLHVRPMGVATYEGVAYRLTAPYSIDRGMSMKCQVDFRNVRAQYNDIAMDIEKQAGHLDDISNR